MDDQPSTHENQRNANEAPTQPEPPRPANPIEPLEQRQTTTQHNTKENPLTEKPKWTDVAIVILTFGIVFLAFVQWREMHDAGAQTDKIIAADERLAAAMEGSVQQSKDSLQATIDQSHLDQRAWVGMNDLPVLIFSAGQPVTYKILVTNSGKSPALHVMSDVVFGLFPKGQKLVFDYSMPLSNPPKSSITIQPAMQIFLASPKNTPLTEQQIAAVTAGELVPFIYGKTTYEDIFRRHHTTAFCIQILPNAHDWRWYGEYNNAD